MDGIKIQVTGNIAKVTEKPKRIIAGTIGLPVEFFFDESWDDIVKTAVFVAGENVSRLDEIDGKTTVPWEVLQNPGPWLSIGVYGESSDGEKSIPTTWANVSPILFGTSLSGDPTDPSAAPIWQKLKDEMESVRDLVEEGYISNASINKDGELELTFMDGSVVNVGRIVNIVDNLGSGDSNAALSARMGGVLKTKIEDDVSALNEQLQPQIKQRVKTVNGVAPDENGNVNVEGGGGGSGEPGSDGFSPVATVIQTGSGAIISITDKSGTTTATVFNGKDGKDGYTPVKGVDYFDGAPGKDGTDGKDGSPGTAGKDGTSVTVQSIAEMPGSGGLNVVTFSDGKTLTVRNGKDGEKGEPGNDGESATHSWNGTKLTITSASGSSSADLKGEKGDTGAPGADGAKGDKGDKGDTGEQGEPGKDGANGKDGVSATHSWNGTTLTITSASGTSSANLKGEKGDKGDQGIQGIQGEPGAKGDKGDTGATGGKGDTGATGATGQRGTGLLPVTTSPASYTNAVGGITPKYRMAISTIKTQAGVTEVLLGDTIRYSYYHYPIAYLDSSYAYFTTRVSIRGATGAAGTTPVKGTDYFTDADKEEFLAGVDAVRYVPQNLTEAQKAQARANIGATAGEDVEFADSVEWLNEYGDTSKKYVLPDGYIYTYTQKTVTVPHDANDGTMTLNARPTPNGTKTATTENNGIVTTAPIEVDNTWPTCVVNVSGLEKLSENFYSTFYVFFYKANGSWVGYSAASHLGFSDSSQTLPISPDITKVTTDGGTWSQVKYVRMAFGVKGSGALTNSDIANLVVNFERLNSTKTENGWYSTGQLHSNDKATQQNSADIAALKEDVETLKANASGGGSGAKWYAIGDSITYGLYSTSASDYSQPVVGKRWVDYVAQYNGYKLTNLGVSGSGFVTGTTFRTVVDRNNFASVDLVTIMLGINDWKNEAAVNKVGTMSDTVGTAYTDKIIPELRYGIEKIISQNPYCKIILITPINAKIGSRGTEASNWAYGYTGTITPAGSLKNFNDKLKEVCEYYGIQVIDMTNSSVVNRKSITTVLPDGIHPNLDCYKALGLELARKITFA